MKIFRNLIWMFGFLALLLVAALTAASFRSGIYLSAQRSTDIAKVGPYEHTYTQAFLGTMIRYGAIKVIVVTGGPVTHNGQNAPKSVETYYGRFPHMEYPFQEPTPDTSAPYTDLDGHIFTPAVTDYRAQRLGLQYTGTVITQTKADSSVVGKVSTWTLTFPYGLLLIPWAFLVTRSAKRKFSGWQRDMRGRNGLCAHCGYDLQGRPITCPECGELAT